MDYLVRSIDKGQNFRVFAAVTTELTETARIRHDTWPVATAALGRALTGSLLLGANLKGNDMLTIRVMGDGPLGAAVVSANGRGEVRGYVQEPHVDLPRRVEGKLPVGDAVGRGILYVTRDLGLKEPFTGSVEIVSGEIAEDLTYYLSTSEQVPSAVSLGVLVDKSAVVKASGGFWLEILPGAAESAASALDANIAGLGSYELSIVGKTPLFFKCACSRKKVADLLLSLGKEEIDRIIEENNGLEVRCHFCGERYAFTPAEIRGLMDETV